ncbi:hypothetical protein SAMN05660816_06752 [Niastella yeongjuensis]|nr:hypothetical protein SAMN05660816_06752 [Niastella yeongjuensis]
MQTVFTGLRKIKKGITIKAVVVQEGYNPSLGVIPGYCFENHNKFNTQLQYLQMYSI